MRNLSKDELNKVQGSGLSAMWARRLGELIADYYMTSQSPGMIQAESITYGAADSAGYNAMGDFTHNMCTR